MSIFPCIASHIVCFLALRLEWIKARARKLRWQEELELLPEEARRSIVFFNAKATEWEQRASLREGSVSAEILEGLVGYAYRQAHLMHQLALLGQQRWLKSTGVPLAGLQPLPQAVSGGKGNTNTTRNRRALNTSGNSSPPSNGDAAEVNKEADNGENEGGDDEDEEDPDGLNGSDTEEAEDENNFTTWLEGGNTD